MSVQQEVLTVWKELSRRERQFLRNRARVATNAVLRDHCRVILRLVQGDGARAIAKSKLCSASQVYRVAKRFLDEGLPGLGDRREDNGDPKVDEKYEVALVEVVGATSPRDHGYGRPTWTQELLIAVLKKKTGVALSKSTMSRTLKRLKIRLGRPKPIVGCPWSKRRKRRRIRQIERLIADTPKEEVVLFADEVDIHLNPKIGRDYMLSGTQKSVLTPGKNQKRYLAGALNARTGRLTFVEYHRKNSDLFILQLWKLLDDYPNARKIHIILDNYRIHSSQRTQIALKALGDRVCLHFLPPYCPDHNRIERIWKDLHDNVTRNHMCKTITQLMAHVRAYMKKKDRELQAKKKAHMRQAA